jgi:GNAT superfamily N-acetyltransferase
MKLRSGTSRDVEIFTRLVNEQHQWLRHENLWEVDELAAILISPTAEPADNDRYLEVAGEAVAAVHVHVTAPFDKGTVSLALPPSANRAEYARTLIEAASRIVQTHRNVTPDAKLQMDVPGEDGELVAVAENLGFRAIQKTTILEGDILDAPAARWPEGTDVASFSVTRDLADGYIVVREAFPPRLGGWHLSEEDYVYSTENDPTALPGLSLIVRDSDGPIGVALNFVDTTQVSTGLVGILGVLRRRQREGIGRAMLLETFDRFRARGWSHARLATVLGMDLDDTDYGLFTSVGLRPIYDNLAMVRGVY